MAQGVTPLDLDLGTDAGEELIPQGNSAVKNVLVVDNVPEWRAHIGRLVAQTFGGAKVHYASSALEAIEIMERVNAVQAGVKAQIDLVLTDLHMSDGAANDNNGDVLLVYLMEQSNPPPVAVVSGTLMDRYKKDLSERMPQIPFLEKDAFLPAAGNSAATGLLVENLRKLARGEFGHLPKDLKYLEMLKAMGSELDPARIEVFADEIKAKTGAIFAQYADYLGQFQLAAFMRQPDLYGGEESGLKIHDFKNQLALLIGEVAGRKDQPVGLTDRLIAFQVYVNSLWNDLVERKEKINLVEAAESVCKRFCHFENRGPKPRFSYDIYGDGAEVAIDRVKFHQVLNELITNALIHAEPGTTVKVIIEGGFIVIENRCEGPLGFEVLDNEVLGDLPESSTAGSGSGTGLRAVLALANETGLKVDVQYRQGVENMVVVEINFEYLLGAGPEGADNAVSEPIIEPGPSGRPREGSENPALDKVVFLCHEGDPEGAFETLMGNKVEGISYHPLHLPFWDFQMGEDSVADKYNREEWERFFRENDDVLFNARLVVAHMCGAEASRMLTPIYERYPHLVFLPASLGSVRILIDIQRLVRDSDDCERQERENPFAVVKSFINGTDVMSYLEAHFPPKHSLRTLVLSSLYSKNYTAEQWAILLEIAKAKALQNWERLKS